MSFKSKLFLTISVNLRGNGKWLAAYDTLIGITETGVTLTESECQAILDLPIISFSEDGKKAASWLRSYTGDTNPTHQLQYMIPKDELIQRYHNENSAASSEEVELINLRALRKKQAIEHTLDDLRGKIKHLYQQVSAHSSNRMKELALGKELKSLEKEFREKEHNLFFEQMQIDVAAEGETSKLTSRTHLDASIRRHFIVKVEGKNGQQ